MKKTVMILLLVLFSVSASAIIIPAGEVGGNWSPEDNPYEIMGEISVNAEETLVIEPGVEVIFNDLYSLTVNGRLVAEGTASDSILFTCSESALGWQAIRFINTNENELGASGLQYCYLEKGAAIGGGELSLGGAVYCSNSADVNIDNCFFTMNYAAWDGGGIYVTEGSDITVSNCLFTQNDCGFYGAGMISYGSAPMLENCEFRDNTSSVFAAGFSAWDDSNPTLINCRFIDNYAGACCGIYGVSSNFEMVNILFTGNETQYGAGGALGLTSCQTEAANVTIIDNISTLAGGAFWVNGGHLDLYNSILWGNLPEQIAFEGSGNATVSNCCIENGFEGSNIIEDNPLFENMAEYDLHLSEDSPCIDAGDATLISFTLPETDLDGIARVLDGDGDGTAEIDLGVYEFELIIIYEPPAHVNMDEQTGIITWQAPTMEGLTGFDIYLDGILVMQTGAGVEEYQFTGLEEGMTYTAAIQAVYEGGVSDLVSVDFIYEPVSVNESELPKLQILGNYPNPFNPCTEIKLNIKEAGIVKLSVYNVKGEHVIDLQNGILTAGPHSLSWNGRNKAGKEVASGIYYYELISRYSREKSSMLLLK